MLADQFPIACQVEIQFVDDDVASSLLVIMEDLKTAARGILNQDDQDPEVDLKVKKRRRIETKDTNIRR